MAIDLAVPEVGESITEVLVVQWRKAEGDPVDLDEPVVELETDKATIEVPSPVTGKIVKILKKEGETANVGEVLAQLEEGAVSAPAKAKPLQKKEVPDEEKNIEAIPAPAEKGRPEAEAPRVMPAAQRLLAEHGLQPGEVQATGPGGRLLKEDVQRHVKQGGAESAAVGDAGTASFRQEEAVPMSPMRLRIAERLVEVQKMAALLTSFNEVDMSAVIALRKQYREVFQEKYGIKLGFMSFFVKAVIDALKQVPQLNARIEGKDIVYANYYDIGIAVSGGKGLVVPVLRNAERMSFAEVEAAIADFAQRARQNKIDLRELKGGTFSITNGGVFGSMLSTPIVNPPQSGILGMHTIQDRPVVRDGEVVVRPMMYVALTYDHRIVDGREAVAFLVRVKECIENPSRMLLEI